MIRIDSTQADAIRAVCGDITLTADPVARVFQRRAVKIKLGVRSPKLIVMDIAHALGYEDRLDAIHNAINTAPEERKLAVALQIAQDLLKDVVPTPEVERLVSELTQKTSWEIAWLVAEIKGVRLYVQGNQLILTEADLNP